MPIFQVTTAGLRPRDRLSPGLDLYDRAYVYIRENYWWLPTKPTHTLMC